MHIDPKYQVYLKDLWKQNWLLVAVWGATGLILWGLCWAFQQPADLAWVFMILSGFALLIYLGFYLRRLHTIKHLLLSDTFHQEEYPQALRPAVQKLQEMNHEIQEMTSASKKEQSELRDYFSLWAHQIKLPLAAMDLQLQLPSPSLEEVAACEKRIQTCVDQAMAYIRLDGSDYRLQMLDPQEVIRPVLRENSSSFISRRIRLETDFDGQRVCTDKKWLGFLVEQLLSNALKYSPDHSAITIQARNGQLTILDEGCGIAPEDLPRLFEKGFTGKNGHQNILTSSGMGLYLCSRVCTQLGCQLTIQNRANFLEKSDPDPSRSDHAAAVSGVVARITFPPTLFFKD